MNEEEKKELIKKLYTLQDSYIEEGYQGFAGVIHETINLLEKQDNIINEMASYIEVNEFDDDIASIYCDGTYDNCKHQEDIGHCRNCIIEYFTKKVGE